MLNSDIKRICLWSSPRNISTALMYSFAQRKDTQVYDEPLYGYYLSHTTTKAHHPGAEEILASMENNGTKVIEMMMGAHKKPVVFFKNMTHHLLHIDRSFMKNCKHIILTRNPKEMLPSFAKVISNPSMNDVGYALQTDLMDYFDKLDIPVVVLDSKRILSNPEAILLELCRQIGIPFNVKMLKWKSGDRPEDGVWAKYWYANVHKSQGFNEYTAKSKAFPERLKPLLDSCIPHYELLMKRAVI